MYNLKQFLFSLIPWGTDVILWVQSWRTPWLDAIFVTASLDRNGALFALLLPLIYWCIDRSLGVELVYLNILAQFATASIKMAFAIPRPEAADTIPYGVMPESFSFPSGHAQVSVTIFGYLALRTRNPWLRLLWLGFIPLISFSRVYLGVHYPQDVIGGILVGLISIGFFCWLYRPIKLWLNGQPTRVLIVISLLIVLFPLLVQFLFAQEGNSKQSALLTSALLAGVSLGLIVETKHVGFSVEGTPGNRILRFIGGLLLIGAIYGLMEIISIWLTPFFPFAYFTKWLQYAVIGWGLTYGAPRLFVGLGLCPSAARDRPVDAN